MKVSLNELPPITKQLVISLFPDPYGLISSLGFEENNECYYNWRLQPNEKRNIKTVVNGLRKHNLFTNEVQIELAPYILGK